MGFLFFFDRDDIDEHRIIFPPMFFRELVDSVIVFLLRFVLR
jgi:hypothetical protein